MSSFNKRQTKSFGMNTLLLAIFKFLPSTNNSKNNNTSFRLFAVYYLPDAYHIIPFCNK